MNKKSTASIFLKGGAVIELDAAKIKVQRNTMTGHFTSIEWENHPDANRRLLDIDPDEIAAVVFNERGTR